MRLCFWLLALLSISSTSVFAQTSCMEFSALNGIYGPSGPNGTPGWYDVFHTEGNIELSAQGFQNLNGSINGSAFVSAGPNQFSGAFSLSNGVFLKTAPTSAMIYEFPVSDTVTFNYYDGGSAINLAVNNEQVMVEADFTDLPTAIAPGVTMTISASGNQGTITLTGYITKVIVGGSNLGIDNFCQYSDATQTCLISEISASPQTCNGSTFMTDIDLIYSDTGSLGFTVSANGTNLGTYSYAQLPITVGPLAGDGTTDWTFTVSDVENTYCTNNENIGPVTCTVCTIENVYAEAFECTSTATYSAYLEFTYSNNSSSNFDVYADGVLVGTFPYTSIPVFPDMTSSSNATQIMTICDGGTSCCVDYSLAPLDCAVNACSMSGFFGTPTCGTDGTFDLELGFSYTNQGTNFNVSGNGTDYGNFAYTDLPITISGLAGDNTTDYVFNITDDTDTTCTGFINTGIVDCPLPCDLSNMTISSISCDSDSTNSFVLDFDFTDDPSSLFRLTVGGTFIGVYNYSSLPATITDIPADGQSISVTACDDSEPTCCVAGSFTSLDCAPPPACDISNFTALPQSCNGTLFNVEVNFTPVNPASSTFVLTGNGTTYGTYDYASLPVTVFLLPGDNVTNYEFFATDSSDPSCSAGINIGTVYCEIPCDFSNLSVDSLLCESDSTYSLVLDLNYSGTVGSSFDLNMNGSFYGNFAYFDLPVTLVNLPADASTVNLEACDTYSPTCCTTVSYTSLDCTPPPVCAITNLTATPEACDAGDFGVTIDFTVTDPVSTTFTLSGNGVDYGVHNYADLPIIIGGLVGDNTTSYEFLATDSSDPNCSAYVNIGTVYCEPPCDLSNATVTSLTCETDSTYSLVFDLTYTGAVGSSFDLNLNGFPFGNFTYAELPITISNLAADSSTVNITACDSVAPSCCTGTTYTSLDCGEPAPPCDLSGLAVDSILCETDSTHSIVINLDQAGTTGSSFNVSIDGSFYGNYPYASLPVAVNGLSSNGNTINLLVCDQANPNCCTEVNYTQAGCITTLEGVPGPMTVSCDNIPSQANVTATNNCSPNQLAVSLIESVVFGSCPSDYTIIREYSASDDCGNQSVATQEITVIDNTGPTLSGVPGPITVSCDSIPSIATVTATDNCDANPTSVVATDVVLPGDCSTGYTINREYSSTDDCGNVTVNTQVITVLADTPPSCDLNGMTVDSLLCESTSTYSMFLNLSQSGTTSTSFNLNMNGVFYGNFAYADLPVQLVGLPADGTTVSLQACDESNSNCCTDLTYTALDCTLPPSCDLSGMIVDSLLCETASTYSMFLNLSQSGTTSTSFNLNMNGVFYGNFAYADLPVQLVGLPADGATVSLQACDESNPNCCTDLTYTALDCTPPPPSCDLSGLTVDSMLCESASTYNMFLNLAHSGTTSTSFNINMNGVFYGNFAYADLPVQLVGLPADGATVSLQACDEANPNCCTDMTYTALDCTPPPACDLSGLTVDTMICESPSTYSTVLNLVQSGTTGTSFNLNMNGVFYGNFAYADLPIQLDGLAADGATVSLQACDEANPNCCTDLTYTAADCGPPPVCEIGNLDIEVLPCDAFGKYNAILDFDHSNTSGTFTVRANLDNFGTFNYADLPVTIGSFSGNGIDYTIEVEDNGPVAGCMSSLVIEGVNCPIPCDITAVETQALDCTSDSTYSVFLDFNYSGSVSSQFKVNASNGQLVGTYNYAQLPVTINNFPAYGATPEIMTISDAENPDCIATRSFDALSCQTVLPCEISGITATASDCDTAGMFTVTIDLTYANVGATFNLTGNNGANYGTYSYTQLPVTVGPLVGNGTTEYEFFVADVDNPNCVNETTVGVIDCNPPTPCELTNLTTVVQDCNFNTGLFMIELDLTPVNGGTNFNVLVNGGSNGSFAYTELPVMVGPFFGDGITNWNITVTDADSPNCAVATVVDPVSCTTQPCELSNLVVDPIECTSGTTISLTLDLDFANTTGGFEVFSSNGSVGFFDYSALPITITDYPISGDSSETVVVCDAMNPNCCTELNFASLDCSNAVCSIDEMNIEILDCDTSGSVSVIVDLIHNDAVADSFQIVGNGITYGNYSYADLPVTVGTFAGDEVSVYELIAIDMNNANCVAFTEFGPIDCILNCELTDLAAEPIACTSDSTYSLQLQFNYQDVSASGFEVYAQGQLMGTYSYADLPLEISDFPIFATNEVLLNVCDLDNPNCCTSITYEGLNCSGGCNIFEVITTPFGCDQGEYMIELDLEYQNVGSLGFQVFGNGENYGNFSYSDLPINFGSFNGDGQTTYEFIVIDLVNTTCFNFAVAEPFDCIADCELSNLHAETECSDSTFMIVLDFDYNNSGADGFMLNGNGTVYGTYSYDSLPVSIGPFEHGDLTDFEFVVTDMLNGNCSNFMAYGQVDCATTSIENLLANNTNLRYDFIGEEVFIQLEEALATDASIEIYNAAGMKVLSTELSAGHLEQRISMAEFASGWYMVRMSNEDGQIALPFVKAR